MKHSDDKRRLFFDMQEHPENYSDEALEQMMAELDRETDAEAAWRHMTERCDSDSELLRLTCPTELP